MEDETMGRRSLIIAMVVCVTLALLPVSSWAVCDQSDLEDTWSTKLCGEVFRGEECWDECTLTIGADDIIKKIGKYTTCSGVSSSVVGGQLTISDGCQIEGTIETLLSRFYIDRGGIVDDKLVLRKTSAARWIRLIPVLPYGAFWQR